MDQRGEPDGADHGQHPVFGHQRQCTGKAEPQAGFHIAFFERVEIGQHHQRQRHELQQVGIIFKALEVEDRIEREHDDDEERAPPVHHAQRREPGNHDAGGQHRHGERIGRPVPDREQLEPEPRDPAGQRRMLAIAELELLAPGERLGDVHVDVLCRLEIDQDQRPQHGMGHRKADHQPRPGFRIDCLCIQPCRQTAERELAFDARCRGRK